MTLRATYEAPPPLLPAWLRALTGSGKRMAPGATMPRLQTRLVPQRADPRILKKYRKLCGFIDDGMLPLPYPQVVAGGLHVALLTDPAFPLPALGIVHVRNHIEQVRPMRADDLFDLTTWVDAQREVAQGVEFDVVTVATVHGVETWRSVLTALSRSGDKKAGAKKSASSTSQSATKAPATVVEPAPERSLLIRVPEDIGRRYARIAGDWNPIHQYAATAKMFGFPRAIAHGMWSLARCLGELQDDLPAGPMTCDVAFKRPVLLPSTVVLRSHHDGEALTFVLRGRDGRSTHLQGSVRPGILDRDIPKPSS